MTDNTEYFVCPIQWKSAGDDELNILEGYASTFGNVDLQGDIIQKGAFTKTIKEGVTAGAVKLLADHDAFSISSVLGTIVEAKEDENGLLIKAKLSSAPDVQNVRTKMLEGHLDRMSIGYRPVKWRFDDHKDAGQVRILEEIKLYEVSVVSFPANPKAAITRVKHDIPTQDAKSEEPEGADLDGSPTTLNSNADGAGAPKSEAEPVTDFTSLLAIEESLIDCAESGQ